MFKKINDTNKLKATLTCNSINKKNEKSSKFICIPGNAELFEPNSGNTTNLNIQLEYSTFVVEIPENSN